MVKKVLNVLEAENISYSYRGQLRAIDGISLSIAKGDFWAILGANGSGKSTLVNLLSGVLSPDQGTVRLLERDISSMSQREIAQNVAFVPQNIQVDFPFTCREIVLMGRFSRLSGLGIEGKEDHDAAESALELTGVSHLAERMIHQLSGGERQRVFIAQAIAAKPRILILDEPISSLDIKYKVRVLELLRSLNENQGITILAILHDLNLASMYAKGLIFLKGGKVFGAGAPDQLLTGEKVQEIYDVPVDVISSADGRHKFIMPSKEKD